MIIYTHNGKAIIVNGKAIAMRTAQPDTYTPILPTDATAFPLYLEGWAKYTVTSVTNSASGSVYIQTGISGKTPSTCFCSDYAGEPSTTSSANRPDKRAQYRYTTSGTESRAYLKDTDIGTTINQWNTYLSGHPIDILFELEESDNSLWFAVTDGTNYGYYNPQSGEFVSVYGMTGTVIERCEYVQGDNDAYCTTNYHLRGDDTLKIKFQVGSNASNIGGSFVASSATDNFCLYAGAGAKWYMRYDGGNNRNYTVTTDWQELVASPTGATVDGVQVETWTQASFTSANPMYIGYLYASSSPKIRGKLAWFEVANKHKFLPVKIGSVYRMFDVLSWELAEQVNAWSGGSVIGEAIEFPTSIYHEPVMLMMGGYPNPEPEPEPEGGEEE